METREVLAWLERKGTRKTREGMARYGIVAPRAFGVPVGAMLGLSKRIGKDHALAAELWKTCWYEARMMAAMVDDPQQVTRRQMNAWAAEFDNWGICDTVCMYLFDKTPFAWEKVRQWSASPREFVKRSGFVLMATLALRDKKEPDATFLAFLPTIEKAASDERNFVMKAVNWALRAIGRRNLALNAAARALAQRLAGSEDASRRWVGRDALRELSSAKVRAQLARRAR